jgi:LAO/AO transport system kinase
MIDLDAVVQGNRLALSRLLTEVENETRAGQEALDSLFIKSGQAHLIGITGAPGTGKSSLVSCLTRALRLEKNKTVAIVAIDPSSPFSGGAILGDRVRMRDLAGDTGVFIRSMASRGELGGLARATAGVVQVLDAVGFDVIMIETVGAGQNEVDIARLAHTTIVVDSPGMGDDIQAIKAGILEIADILVINKADHPGVENTERALRANLDLGYAIMMNHKAGHAQTTEVVEPQTRGWIPPVIKTIATQNSGIDEVVTSITEHKKYLRESGLWIKRDQERLRTEVEHQLQAKLVKQWKDSVSPQHYESVLQQVFARKVSPGAAILTLIERTPYN